jgi:hypothetical protein
MNKSQKMMVEDGLPLAFVMSDDDRLDWWKRYPPKNTQAFLDPRIEQDRLLRETMKQEATKKRIMALRQSKGLIDASEQTTNPNQPQESNMPKYTVKPLDAHGHPVIRAITSINDDAAEEEINQKVLAAAKRGGSKVANVLLINTLSEVVLAWSIVEGVAGPCDAGPFQPVMQPPDGVYRNLTNEPEVQQNLVRLITPPKGTVLDPFAGTGTTGEAAWREGFGAVLIEREAEYQADIKRRMALCLSGPDERTRASIKEKMKDKAPDHGPLFGGTEITDRGGRGRQIYGHFAD